MTPEQFQRVHALLDAIRDIAPDDREAWLAARCDDESVRAEVAALLVHDDQPHTMLDEPLFDLGAALGVGPAPSAPSPAPASPSEAFFTNRPDAGRTDTTSDVTAASGRTGRLLVTIVLALILLAGVFLVGLIIKTAQGPATTATIVDPIDANGSNADGSAPDLTPVITALTQRDVGRALALLRQVPPAARAWEWDALAAHADPSLGVVGTHAAEVVAMAWSPDARRLATADAAGTVHVWDVDTRAPIRTLTPSAAGGPVHALAFSRFGATLTVVARNTVRTFSATSGTQIDETPAAAPIVIAAWNHPPTHLATADETGAITIRPDGDDADDTPPVHVATGAARVRAMTLSADGGTLAVATDDDVRAWRAGDPTPLGSWPLASATALVFDPTTDHLLAGTGDGAVTRIDVDATGVDVVHAGDAAVTALTFDAGGSRLVIAADDDTIALWNGSDMTRVATRITGAPAVCALAPGGEHLATASADGTVRLWSWDAVDTIATGSTSIVRMRVGDGIAVTMATGDAGPVVRTHDLATGGTTALALAPVSSIGAMDLVAGTVVYAVGDTVHRADIATAAIDPTARLGLDAPILDLAGLPDQRRVVAALGSRMAIAGFDDAAPRTVDVSATRVAVDARGRRIAAIGTAITVLRVSTLDVVRAWPAPGAPADAEVGFTPDGRLLVTAGDTLSLYDVDTGERTDVPLPPDRRGPPVALRDGTRIAFVDGDGIVHVRDTHTGVTTVTLPAGPARATGVLGVDASGETLIIALDDGTLRVWITAASRSDSAA